ncbi:unnamed protein product [Protopolystoma xenopodis]|uniref:Uncharacterized protein n=1 Tax=Protopolystoma xenopodis TaxID=117903 RepID=A0A448WET1_9PLAT|nr:unnamed protein product [Protopolystoma xenopodis]
MSTGLVSRLQMAGTVEAVDAFESRLDVDGEAEADEESESTGVDNGEFTGRSLIRKLDFDELTLADLASRLESGVRRARATDLERD